MKFTRESIIVGALVLIALFAGSWFTKLLPSPSSVSDEPFERVATIGEPVTLRTGTLRVTSVTATTRLANAVDEATTTGAFVVVRFQFTPKDTTMGPTIAIVEDAQGRTFGGSPISSGCNPLTPGLTVVCAFSVETDAKAVQGPFTVQVPAQYRRAGDDVAVIEIDHVVTKESEKLEFTRFATAGELP